MCGERVPERHAHLVDIEQRSIGCACTACGLLFTRPGGRYRTVPDRVRHDPDAPLTGAEWAELGIPVGIAFFFVNSALGHVVASYPSPAGVTECELDLAGWDRLAAAHPLLRAPLPDVEAILIVAGSPRLAGGPAPRRSVPARTTAPKGAWRRSSSRSTCATRWRAACGCTGAASTAARKHSAS